MLIDLRKTCKSKWTRSAICLVVGANLVAGLSYRYHHVQLAAFPRSIAAYCDTGIRTAKARAAAVRTSPSDAAATAPVIQAEWTPRISHNKPNEPAPAGMIWIAGGQFWMGTDDQHMPDAKPWHPVYVDAYWMDKTEVTNEQFAWFAKDTGYITVAERKPRAEEFPGAPPQNLVAGSVVFTPPNRAVALNNHFQWWSYAHGANWRHPEGPDSDIKDRMNHPVVHIAYEDAVAFCKWAGKRLPTEAEFEFASRGGLDRKRYDWGDEFMPGGKPMANTFQGHFPDTNTGEDGYVATAPGPSNGMIFPCASRKNPRSLGALSS